VRCSGDRSAVRTSACRTAVSASICLCRIAHRLPRLDLRLRGLLSKLRPRTVPNPRAGGLVVDFAQQFTVCMSLSRALPHSASWPRCPACTASEAATFRFAGTASRQGDCRDHSCLVWRRARIRRWIYSCAPWRLRRRRSAPRQVPSTLALQQLPPENQLEMPPAIRVHCWHGVTARGTARERSA
jgi:hypothetical protein